MADIGPTVRNIMVKNVRTVLPQAPLIRAAQIMVQCRIRHLVVVESDGEVVGVISERQVLKHFSPWLTKAHGESQVVTLPPPCEVREVMVGPAITITADTSVRAASRMMASKKIGCLPVVEDNGRLVGLIAAVDLLRLFGENFYSRPQEEFHVFMPPAFFSESGNLTLPLGYFPEGHSSENILAVLAYAPKGKRIGVKLFKRGEGGEDLRGARVATVTDKYVIIPAEDFVKHHNLNIRGSLEVVENKETGYLCLSPVMEP